MRSSHPSPWRRLPDIAGGLFLLAVGLFFLLGSFRYGIGTAVEMGPGFFPMLLGAASSALALLVLLSALVGAVREHERPAWRPFLAVVASIAAFGVTIASLGMLPAAALAVILVSQGDPGARLAPTLALAAAVCLGAWLIFSVGLGLPIPLAKVPL